MGWQDDPVVLTPKSAAAPWKLDPVEAPPAFSRKSLDSVVGPAPTVAPRTATEIAENYNPNVHDDTWADTGRKFVSHIGPLLKQSAGGAVQALAEMGAIGGGEGGLLTPDQVKFQLEIPAILERERKAGKIPGQQLYAAATADLEKNGYAPGSSTTMKYAGMLADSLTQLVPAVAASFATRNPYIAGAVVGGQVAGGQYGESRAAGRRPEQAAVDAVFNGAAEAIGEEIPVGLLLKPGGKFLPSLLKTSGAEGLQEVLTQILQTGYDKGVLHPEMTWGEARQQIIDAGIVGSLMGGSLHIATAPLRPGVPASEQIVDHAPQRPIAPGVRETAVAEAAQPTEADAASPIPTDLIAAGKAKVAGAVAKPTADNILAEAGLPASGSRVQVDMGDGRRSAGTITDAFHTDAGEAGVARGVKIAMDDGSTFAEHFDTLRDAGVTINPLTAEADRIDAQLAASAAAPTSPIIPAKAPTIAPPAPSIAPSGDITAAIRQAESGGSDTAKNPNSSASGRYQFTDKTWLATYRSEVGDTGESDAQILAHKTDGPIQDRLFKRLTADNVAFLQRNGLPTDAGTVYLAHFAGAPGAKALLTADQNASAESVLGAAVIKANPFLAGKTAGDTIAWAAKKVGGPAYAGASSTISTERDPIAFTAIDYGDGAQAKDNATDTPLVGQEAAAEPATNITENIPEPEIARRDVGKTDTAVTGTGRQVPVNYAIVEAKDLVASNDAAGNANPAYPARLQPRDRTRGVSQAQVTQIAGNLNPRLLGESPKASDGAPIISPQGVVESGNGRTLAIRQAYDAAGPQADGYRTFLKDQGYDTSGFDQPVLVRVRSADLSGSDVEAFTREANARDTLGYSATEQAMSDAKALPASALDLYRGGDLDSAGNRDFVRGFLQSVVPDTEYAGMVAKDGSISQQAIARVRAALLGRAYGDASLVGQVAEATDSDIKSIGGALTDVAGAWAKLVEATKDGRVDASMDITADVNAAVQVVDRARREGKSIVDIVGQRDIFSGATVNTGTEAVLRLMFGRPDYTRPTSRKRLGEALQFYVDQAIQAAPGGGLFGESTAAQPNDILGLAKDRQNAAPETQPDLLAATKGEPAASARSDAPAPEPVSDRPVGESLPANRGDQTQRDVKPPSVKADPVAEPTPTPEPASNVTIDLLPSSKSVLIRDASPDELAAIRAVVPKIKPLSPRSGGVVYPAKYEFDIRAALAQKPSPTVRATSNDGTSTGGDGAPSSPVISNEVGTRDAPVTVDTVEDLRRAENEIVDGTDAQREAGNHAMAHIVLHGLNVTLEIPKGGERRGKGPDGEPWAVTLPAAYGYVKRTTGADGEQFDVYVGDDVASEAVFVIDQVKPDTKEFDEHKAILGTRTEAEARDTYEKAFSDGRGADRIGGIKTLSIDDFRQWIETEPDAPVAAVPTPDATATNDALTPPSPGLEPLYDEGEDAAQIGWFDPATGAVTRIESVGNLTKDQRASRPSGVEAEPDAKAVAAKQSRVELPTISVRASDWGKLPDREAARLVLLRGRVLRWYKALEGTTTIDRDGRTIQFNAAGRKKTLRAGPDLLIAARAIPGVLARGVHLSSERSNRPGMKAIHRYGANVRVDDKTIPIVAIVREANDGTFHYSLNDYREVGPDASAETDGDAKKAIALALEGNAGPDSNLAPDTANVNEPDAADEARFDRIDAVQADLRKRLAGYGIADKVQAIVVDKLFLGKNVAGQYLPGGFISVALDSGQDAAFTLDHEAIHALRDMGAILPVEWRALTRAAQADAATMASVKARYRNLDAEARLEEAVADRFAAWMKGATEKGFARRAFERVRDLVRSVGQALRGQGFTTAESVMRSVAAGKVGARVSPSEAPKRAESVPRQSRTAASGFPGPFQRNTDDSDTDIANAVATVSALGQDAPGTSKGAEVWDRLRTTLQDKMLPLLRTQQAIEAQTGTPLTEAENPYLGEELMSGRVGGQLEHLADEMIEPLFGALSEEGVTVDELESYLYARHAPERNARIAAINPEFGAGEGSGLTDAEAASIVAAVDASGKREALDRLAARVDALTAFSIDTRVAAGLLSQSDAAAWRSQYQHYVPLRGRGEDVSESDGAVRAQRGSGITVTGKESKRAFGRKSKAGDILAYTILQAEEAIVRSETNRVGQQFLDLARGSPDPEFWTVNKVTRRAVFNKATGQVQYRNETRIAAEDADYTVSAKVDGEEFRVTLNRDNPVAVRVADSMRNLSAQQVNQFAKYAGVFTRFFSKINTSLNPEFIITNALRDIQAAGVNLQQHDAKGLVTGIVRDWRKALLAPKKGDGEWAKWRREFELAGGKVFFNDIGDLNALRSRVERLAARSDRVSIKSAARAVFDTINVMNDRVENAVRLAAYKNAREAGLSQAKAASIARNSTVNFTRRGSAGPLINSFFAFFNAGVQGSATLVLAAKRSKKVRAALVGFVAAGFLNDLLNRWLTDDDDDGESYWDKTQSYDKQKNLIVMLPGTGGKSIKLPLGLGLNAFFSLGRNISEIMHGRSASQAGWEAVTTAVDAFNPLGNGSILTTILPTALDPLAELGTNRNFANKPIQPDPLPFGEKAPASERYFPSVSTASKAVAHWLNEITGGDEVVEGRVSVSPEVLDYVAAYFTGGAGRFVMNTANLAAAPFDPERDLTVSDFPFARKVVGEKPVWLDKSLFYDRANQVTQTIDHAKSYRDSGNNTRFSEYLTENAPLVELETATKQAQKGMKIIRKTRAANEEAHTDGSIDDASYRANLDDLKVREAEIVTGYNLLWNETVVPPKGGRGE